MNGTVGNKSIWFDWSAYDVEPYRNVASWYFEKVKLDVNKLWNNFYEVWKINNEKAYIKNLIDWYLHSNLNKVYIEECIVLTQVAFELLFNWIFIDSKKVSQDKEKKEAHWKIGKLIGECGINRDLPSTLPFLNGIQKIQFKNAKGEPLFINSGPQAIAELRNAIVHGNEWRRDNLDKIEDNIRVDIWILGNWYLELLILFKLGYEGEYNNRSVSMRQDASCIEKVPWAK